MHKVTLYASLCKIEQLDRQKGKAELFFAIYNILQ
jgi:hypothetical protein